MASVPDYTAHDYNGGAVKTSLTDRIIDTDITFTVNDGSTLPLGSGGKWVFATIDRGLTSEERIAYSPRVGNTLQNVLRGVDGTTPTTHEAGAFLEHGLAAQDVAEANNVVVAIGGATGATASKALTDAFTPANAVTANALSTAFSTTNATNAKNIYTAANTAGTWTPVYSAISDTFTVSDDGSVEARYFQIGKLVWFNINTHIRVLGGTGSGQVGITLPVAANLGGGNSHAQFANQFQGATVFAGVYDSTHLSLQKPSGNWDNSGSYTWCRVSGFYEAV